MSTRKRKAGCVFRFLRFEEWVPANLILGDGLASQSGRGRGGGIPPVASCYKIRDKLLPDRPVGLYAVRL